MNMELITLIVICGVGADLCIMPLAISIGALMLGIQEPPESLAWLATWWMLAIALVALVSEMALDTIPDRRNKFSSKVWPKAQHIISAVVSMIVVFAFSEGLSKGEIVTCMGSAWIATGIIKEGLMEKFKKGISWGVGG